jgi:hypothetical protein
VNRRRPPGIWLTSHLANPSATELRQTSNGAVPVRVDLDR